MIFLTPVMPILAPPYIEKFALCQRLVVARSVMYKSTSSDVRQGANSPMRAPHGRLYLSCPEASPAGFVHQQSISVSLC